VNGRTITRHEPSHLLFLLFLISTFFYAIPCFCDYPGRHCDATVLCSAVPGGSSDPALWRGREGGRQAGEKVLGFVAGGA